MRSFVNFLPALLSIIAFCSGVMGLIWGGMPLWVAAALTVAGLMGLFSSRGLDDGEGPKID